MYIEKNGYVIMKVTEMNFYGNDSICEEDVEDATIFDDYSEALQLAKDLSKEYNDTWEVIRYNRTVWLDKYFINKDDKIENNSCCEGNCCKKQECNNIDDTNYGLCSFEEAVKQQKKINEVILQSQQPLEDKINK